VDAPLALFAGVPQPHKGWPVLTAGLSQPAARHWHLVIAGAPEHPEFQAAARVLTGRCHLIGPQPHNVMPDLLAAIDAVPVPQLDVRFAKSQLPAKLVEAMAMARPAIATRVGDLPDIVGEHERGWLIPPGDPSALACALDEIARMPALAHQRGRAARVWYLAEASQDVIERRVSRLIEDLGNPAPALAPSKRPVG
jgi:glycosyltransferase involved in cell wall biosynthesis